MRKLVLGVLVGFLVAASVALAYDVTFPSRLKVQAHALVDELGNVLLGSTAAKIEVTNWPSGGGGTVTGVRDSNGALVGTISREYTLGGPPWIVRNVGGVLVEMSASHFLLDGSVPPQGTPLYFSSNDCSGPAYVNPGNTGAFYPGTFRVGSTLFFASAPPADVDINSYRNPPSGPNCTAFAYGQLPMSPAGTLDLAQFPAPYFLE